VLGFSLPPWRGDVVAEVPVVIEIERRDVIATGSLITAQGDKIIKLAIADLSFEFEFEEKENEEPRVSSEMSGAKGLRVILTNFNNSLGSSWDSVVGTMMGKKLRLSLYVLTTGQPTWRRSINYTFSLEVAQNA
jgi:hypothetical protein